MSLFDILWPLGIWFNFLRFISYQSLPKRPLKPLNPLQESNPSFWKAANHSCHVGPSSQHLLQLLPIPRQPQPQSGPQTWLQPQIEQVSSSKPQPQPQSLSQTWLQPQIGQAFDQVVALTDETVNDNTNKTASKTPTVFFTICFPINPHSPNVYLI